MGHRKLAARSTPAQRAAAVALYESSGRSARVVAEELGIRKATLESWIRDHERAVIDPDGTMSEERLRQVQQLQRENQQLRREVEFLKKADAFFREIDHGETSSR